jgi:hypothetical protein
MVIDANDEVEMLESKNTSAHEIFETAKNIYIGEISMAILGSESLGQEKSFVGSVQESSDLANTFALNDIKFVEKWFKTLVSKLVNLGLTEFDGLELVISRAKEADKQELFTNVIELMKAGGNIDPEFIEEKFGIPLISIDVKDESAKSDKESK